MKILAPNPNTPVPSVERALCVFRPVSLYPSWERLALGRQVADREDLGDATSFLRQLPTGPSRVLISRINPRPAGYMLQQAREFATRFAPNAEVDLLVEADHLSHLSPSDVSWLRRVWGGSKGLGSLDPTLTQELSARNYDALVLLYPDAIGLGWGRTERVLARLRIPTTLVINGRRRVFVWDAESRRALRRRRAAEKLWVAEMALALVIALGGVPLTAWDFLGRLFRKFRRVRA
ncbi:MAG: hypothetical protein A3F84_23055 [Candidatus Handelsmanbacteria bacterium RIFCSPLOWO2_12_FULL_64_10]|uniref:Uncharacterized protein n=1 Tax=Handelsmanbacteria sp. (strain RIFCSPLOWO2_12_FULL_64_10) TaxID=1817868 RepID=A0A1F6CGM4_HANXR|nr:MAG: hypothetical protein A3F84_23055 [Candidatus Handelsmanbacteria bacterium RIFCSPLOWO2_12_FULL_64_10]